jgi:hypothetical protein
MAIKTREADGGPVRLFSSRIYSTEYSADEESLDRELRQLWEKDNLPMVREAVADLLAATDAAAEGLVHFRDLDGHDAFMSALWNMRALAKQYAGAAAEKS